MSIEKHTTYVDVLVGVARTPSQIINDAVANDIGREAREVLATVGALAAANVIERRAHEVSDDWNYSPRTPWLTLLKFRGWTPVRSETVPFQIMPPKADPVAEYWAMEDDT